MAVSLHILPIWFKSHFPTFSWLEQPLAGQDIPIIEASRSHSPRNTTLGRSPLYEWSAWRRDLYLSTYNTRKKQTSMVPARFERAILASERAQTHGHWDRYFPILRYTIFAAEEVSLIKLRTENNLSTTAQWCYTPLWSHKEIKQTKHTYRL